MKLSYAKSLLASHGIKLSGGRIANTDLNRAVDILASSAEESRPSNGLPAATQDYEHFKIVMEPGDDPEISETEGRRPYHGPGTSREWLSSQALRQMFHPGDHPEKGGTIKGKDGHKYSVKKAGDNMYNVEKVAESDVVNVDFGKKAKKEDQPQSTPKQGSKEHATDVLHSTLRTLKDQLALAADAAEAALQWFDKEEVDDLRALHTSTIQLLEVIVEEWSDLSSKMEHIEQVAKDASN